MFQPRPKQQAVLNYTAGKMGVSAVPGSGKTQTLSILAAKLLASGHLNDDQEVLIVTLVNSAVNNFSQRISGFMQSFGLLPNLGYRVRTLHGLAHDIVRERPDLVGLDTQFQIVDERETYQILNAAVTSWIKRNPEFIKENTRIEQQDRQDVRFVQGWQNTITSIARNFIRQAKDMQATPQKIQESMHQAKIDDPFLNMGIEVYTDYQRALIYRSGVDFDDLIRLALKAIELDSEFRERLKYRWPYILEDEAQDSSRLQEKILRILTDPDGNWVRVGDPNQAIYETFTTASPEYLKDFLNEADVIDLDLPNSGRSTRSIILLANELIRWTMQDHPVESVRSALTTPFIQPSPPQDPQPNPADRPEAVHLFSERLTADKEIELVVKSVKKWLADHPEETCAVLIPRNERGARVVEHMELSSVPHLEILQTSQTTRETAGLLSVILGFLADPAQTSKIVRVFDLLQKHRKNLDEKNHQTAKQLLRSCSRYEEFFYPLPDHDWLKEIAQDHPPEIIQNFENFRDDLIRWQKAAILPVNQLLITLGQDLFIEQTDLALTHKLALLLEQAARAHPDWHLPQFAEELDLIASNRRKLSGFTEEDNGFDPDAHKGKVVVTTYHKAKGLEWDRVYLMSVNNYDFPSAVSGDEFLSEKWFYRSTINLEAETLHKLKTILENDPVLSSLEEGYATQLARYDYAAERLRLFFVGITRAKKELIVTWNIGDTHHSRRSNLSASLPFIALQNYWKELKL